MDKSNCLGIKVILGYLDLLDELKCSPKSGYDAIIAWQKMSQEERIQFLDKYVTSPVKEESK